MNREEAKYLYIDGYQFSEGRETSESEIIDAVYDDFESRTCENCKHYQEVKFIDFTQEENGQIEWEIGTQCVKLHQDHGKDFGCIFFGIKDAK